ncbi:lipopolysaccharide-induced tumor necrosis factor-alpha factor homolog [Andrena cerasifolii]|uniref:lipopolysaccharide-induced tumor necrosis factor-alpha factor homolog n=1 Tax=Andrena cerasifolii TaxID=2819439 RepID=UPI0040378C7B
MEKGMPPSSPPPAGFAPGPAYGGPPIPPPMYTEGQPNIVYVSSLQFGSESQHLTCPHCHASITTSVQTEANSKTHLFALLICVLGGWCCAPCPYCMDSCLVKKHYCPACKAYLGESTN